MTTRLKTLDGKVATRRIKWFNPKSIEIDGHGNKVVLAFIVCKINSEGLMELIHVGSQLGVDGKGRHVVPKSVFVHESRNYGVIYSAMMRVGHLTEDANNVISQINQIIIKTWWNTQSPVLSIKQYPECTPLYETTDHKNMINNLININTESKNLS